MEHGQKGTKNTRWLVTLPTARTQADFFRFFFLQNWVDKKNCFGTTETEIIYVMLILRFGMSEGIKTINIFLQMRLTASFNSQTNRRQKIFSVGQLGMRKKVLGAGRKKN